MKTFHLIAAALLELSLSVSAPAQTLSNYQSTVMSQGPISYFTLDPSTFDGSTFTNSVAGNTSFLSLFGSGGFAFDVFGDSGEAVFFTAVGGGFFWGGGPHPQRGAPAPPQSPPPGSPHLFFQKPTHTH